MIDRKIYPFKEIDKGQEEYIEKMILLILKEQKVSLAQTRCVFNHILNKIEMKNPINI